MNITVALDIGNSGGKVLAATMDNGHLEILEERTIPNVFVNINGFLYWDLFRIFRDLKEAMKEYSRLGDVISIGIDGTCGSYGYINKNGRLAGQVSSSRDQRFADWQKVTEQKIDLRSLYDRTGVYPMGSNVICKILCDLAHGDLVPGMDVTFAQLSLMLQYFLTGEISVERSMAGASVLMDREFHDWNYPLLEELGIPVSILPRIAEPGEWGSLLRKEVAEETNCPNCRFVHTVEFDSSTAAVSAPGLDYDQIYLSMGTTINPGVERKAPLINDLAWEFRYKNVPIWEESYLLLSDVPGFFLLSECLSAWKKEIPDLDYGDLILLAEKCETHAFLPIFDRRLMVKQPDMPEQVRAICRETGQEVPETIGEVTRVILESYAATIAWSVGKLCRITGRDDYTCITAISGGSRNALLCQMIADASGYIVRAGDPKATCLGNLLVQFYAQGKLASLKQMREEAARICPMKEYEPRENEHLQKGLAYLTENGFLKK
ncbi:MAG: hypothetical protein II930_09430 [Lachnospiraceae bacterium]|nr:hypothetical protein [Lachnospiraceae bacterium]